MTMTLRRMAVCGFLCALLIMGISTGTVFAQEAQETQETQEAQETQESQEVQESQEEEEAQPTDKKTLGLKELLKVGIETAVKLVGVEDGFYGNEGIKILMPEKLKKVDSLIRKFGGKKYSDALIKKMNRAAEKAAPLALDIFLEAIKNIKFSDVMGLLSGKENAATEFLETSTSDTLKETFYPIVKNTMEEIKAVKAYNDYIGKYSSNPLAQSLDLELDISKYVTGKAIDGLFVMVAKEEEKIRKDPAARVTDLLKGLFGK